MKTMQRSWGKTCRPAILGFILVLLAGLVSCQTAKMGSTAAHKDSLSTKEKETSLASDQREIERLRKNIPPEKREENDKLKEILQLTVAVTDHPARIREKFNRQTQRMRESHRREMQDAREEFNKNEKKKREEFYAQVKKEREQVKNKKMSRQQQQDFYDNQAKLTRDFSANERDARSKFNADLKVKDDDFNSMMREKNNEFNAQMKDYTQKYNELEKQKRIERRPKVHSVSDADEANRMGTQGVPPQPLKTGDDGP